jgi:Ty3 transposon capsid-like protein/Zinc knuckle
MSVEAPVTDSPLSFSSADTAVIHDDSDALIFSGMHTKEKLRDLALCRLSELRNEKAALLSDKAALQADKLSLQKDKANQQTQIEELRQRLAGVQASVEDEKTLESDIQTNYSTTLTSPPSQTPGDRLQSSRKQLTKPALPEKFNGVDKVPTISNWLFSIRLYLRVTQTEKEDLVVLASTFFSGTALDWWQGIERVEGESIYQWNWEEFTERCVKRFQASNDAQLAFQRLLRWKQTGHITAYLSVFQSLIQQIPLTLLTEQGRVFVLIEGLNNDLQKSVRLMQPATVDEAINVAQRASATYHAPSPFQQTFTRPNYRHPSTTTRSSSKPNHTTTGSRFAPLVVENVEEVNETQPDSPPGHSEGRTYLTELEFSYLNAEQKKLYREKRCFNCKKIGHFSSECRSIKEQARM